VRPQPGDRGWGSESGGQYNRNMVVRRDRTANASEVEPELSPEDRAWLEEKLEAYRDLLDFLRSN